jgi:cytochrome o ubiquinol oxidase subunit 1
MSFGLIWYMWWLAAMSFVAIIAVAIAHTFHYDHGFHIAQDDVVRAEAERTKLLAANGVSA